MQFYKREKTYNALREEIEVVVNLESLVLRIQQLGIMPCPLPITTSTWEEMLMLMLFGQVFKKKC